MKKFICIALVLVLTVSLAACTAAKKAEPAASASLANPMQEVDAGALEFALNVPADASDAHYFTFTMDGGNMSEAQFKLNGKDCFARAKAVAEVEPVDFSGLNYKFDEADAEVCGMAAKVYTCGEAGFISFVDVAPGIAYNVGCVGETSADELIALAESCYVPMQGEAG